MNLIEKILNGENVRQSIDEASERKFHAKYIISSERADRRSDEDHVEFNTNRIMNVGDSFELDGLTWYVDEVVSDLDSGLGEEKKFNGSGKKINFEDDFVKVYDKYGKEVYSGIEDYEPMKDADWKFDSSIGAYRFDGYIKNCVG